MKEIKLSNNETISKLYFISSLDKKNSEKDLDSQLFEIIKPKFRSILRAHIDTINYFINNNKNNNPALLQILQKDNKLLNLYFRRLKDEKLNSIEKLETSIKKQIEKLNELDQLMIRTEQLKNRFRFINLIETDDETNDNIKKCEQKIIDILETQDNTNNLIGRYKLRIIEHKNTLKQFEKYEINLYTHNNFLESYINENNYLLFDETINNNYLKDYAFTFDIYIRNNIIKYKSNDFNFYKSTFFNETSFSLYLEKKLKPHTNNTRTEENIEENNTENNIENNIKIDSENNPENDIKNIIENTENDMENNIENIINNDIENTENNAENIIDNDIKNNIENNRENYIKKNRENYIKNNIENNIKIDTENNKDITLNSIIKEETIEKKNFFFDHFYNIFNGLNNTIKKIKNLFFRKNKNTTDDFKPGVENIIDDLKPDVKNITYNLKPDYNDKIIMTDPFSFINNNNEELIEKISETVLKLLN